MKTLATTKLSSKGQVVIPEDIRKRMKLRVGAQFVVVGEEDVVILKTIKTPSMKDFDALIRKARGQARTSGIRRSDIGKAVRKVRDRK